MFAFFGAAWTSHTDDSRDFAHDIANAIDDIGMSRKEASITMRLTDEAELSKQLAGTKPLNAFRLAYLPSAFHVAFLRRRAARLGAAVIPPEDLALIRGAAVLGVQKIAELIPDWRLSA